MTDLTANHLGGQVERPEFVLQGVGSQEFGVVEKPLSTNNRRCARSLSSSLSR
jgi:hypothetical protein